MNAIAVTSSFLVALSLSLPANNAVAALASDNATDAVYNNGWTTGDDGGSGFTGWTLDGGTANSGHYIGDSTSGGANINVSGESFAMYGHDGEHAGATRGFDGGSLAVGDQFSFVLAVNFRNGNKGFNLFNGANVDLWNFNVGSDHYTAGGSSIFSDAYAANTIFSFVFTQNSSSIDWSITRSGDLSGTTSGTIPSGTLDHIRFYIDSTGTSAENNLYFNSLQAVPEPTHIALGIFGGVFAIGCGVRRFTRKAQA